MQHEAASREPSGPAGEVSAELTPANASQVAAAIVAALRAMGRKVTRQESWLYPLAVSQLETGRWRKLWNNNVGNVSAWDIKKQSWYLNPEVHEKSPHPFRAFGSLPEGARGMLDAIKHHGGLDAADAGDLVAFQAAMTKYLSNVDKNGNPVPYPDLSGVIAQLRGTIVDVS